MTVKAIDVSSYQTTTYATAGLGLVIVKATEGTAYTSPKYTAQVAHGRASDLVVGHYHFARPGSMTDQLAYFRKHTDVRAGDLVAFDWEDTGVSEDAKNAWIKAAQAAMPHTRVLLYCNRDFWLRRDRSGFFGDGLWIADPDAPAGRPRIEAAWTVHQYGIAQGTDRNVTKFPTVAALRTWAAKGTTPTTTTTPPKGATVATPKTSAEIVADSLAAIGDIGTTDPSTPSKRKEFPAGYYLAHILDEQRTTNDLLRQVLAAVAPTATTTAAAAGAEG